MMTLDTILKTAIAPAMALLKGVPDSRESRCLLLAIGLQESRFEHRRQMGNGPARGFWQFETGGVRGVVNHATSAGLLRKLDKTFTTAVVSTGNPATSASSSTVPVFSL